MNNCAKLCKFERLLRRAERTSETRRLHARVCSGIASGRATTDEVRRIAEAVEALGLVPAGEVLL